MAYIKRAEFDALVKRVEALEKKKTTPPTAATKTAAKTATSKKGASDG